MSRRCVLDAALVAVLFLGSHRLYRASPGDAQMCDSCYSLAVTEALLQDGSVNLAPRLPADPGQMAKLPGFDPETGRPYHLVHLPAAPGAVYYGYPLGSSVLSLPLVVYYSQARHVSAFGPDGGYFVGDAAKGETALQLRVAAVVTAATIALFYLILRAFTPAGLAFLLAAGFAAGSMAWSTLSRSLWSHTWAVFLTAAAVLVLVRLDRRTTPTARGNVGYGFAFGTLLFWMYLTRPHTALSALAVLAYLALWHRRVLLVTVPVGLAWVGGLVAVSLHTFGTPLPPSVYSSGEVDWVDVPFRFAYLMAGPSRGLLTCCPYLLIVGTLLVAYRRQLPSLRLLVPAGLAVGAYVVVFSGYRGWHGGYCFGPRYFSDVLPWLVLATAVAAGGWLPGGWTRRRWAEGVVLAACFAWAGFVHGRGAVSQQTWWWNYGCHTNADHVRAVTDWGHPQFLAGWSYGVDDRGAFK